MPASLTPQSLPPGSPTIAMYLSDSTVVMCMRAGLYQTKNGLLVFFGIVAVEEVDDLGRDFLVHGLRALQRQRTLVLAGLVRLACRRTTCTARTGRGGVRQVVVFGSTAPGTSARPGDRRVPARRSDALLGRGLVDVGEAHALHRVEVIEVAPELLEAVRGRQRRRSGRRDGSCRTRRWCSPGRAGTWRAPACRAAGRTGCRAVAAGSCRCAADVMPVKKALRPAVQLCSA